MRTHITVSIVHLTCGLSCFLIKKNSFAMERSVRITWSIKGYHYFQVRPHVDIIMKVEPEPNNPRDPFAMKVVMPALYDIPAEYHDNSTRDATSSRPRQTVRQIAGKSLR